VLRGPQSALYGSDAMGGVINIITRRGKGAPQGWLMSEGGPGTSSPRASISGADRAPRAVDSGLHADGFPALRLSSAAPHRDWRSDDAATAAARR
jgi:vitamin B12 transporter